MKKLLLLLLLSTCIYAVTRIYTRYGDTTIGPISSHSPNYIQYSRVTVAVASRLDSVVVYTQFGTPSVRGALYAADGTGGNPGTLLDTTDAVTALVNGWTHLEYNSKVTLEPGNYWVGLLSSGSLWHAKEAGTAGTSGFEALNYSLPFPETATLTALSNLSNNDVYIVTSVAADVDKQNKYVGFGGSKKY